MKIGLTISEKDQNSVVDSRFGRCKYFLIYDETTGERKIIDNSQNLNAAQGAGIQSAQNILREGIDVLITGNVGPKAFNVLSGSNVKIYLIDESVTVDEALKLLKSGTLKNADQATKPGHW